MALLDQIAILSPEVIPGRKLSGPWSVSRHRGRYRKLTACALIVGDDQRENSPLSQRGGWGGFLTTRAISKT